MKKYLVFACLPLCLAGFFASPVKAQADTSAEAQQALEAAYAQMDAAMVAKDPSGILNLRTSDFKEVEKDGKVLNSQKSQIAVIGELEIALSIHSTTSVQNVQIQGDGMALATVKSHTTIVFADDKTDTLDHGSFDETDRDLWQNTDQGWREKISHTITETRQIQKQSLAVSVPAQVKEDVKDAIQDVCGDADAAIVRGDVDTAGERYENPALRLQDQNTLTKLLAAVHDITSITNIQSVKIVNKAATQALLIVHRHIGATLNETLNDQPETNEIDVTAHELWDKDANGWHEIAGHIQKLSFLVNGTAVHIAGVTVP